MGTAVPLNIFTARKAEPSFVDKSGGLKSLPGRFVGHFVRGEFAEFFVNQRKELIGGFGVTLMDGIQDLGDFAHWMSLKGQAECSKPNCERPTSDRMSHSRARSCFPAVLEW